MSTRWTQADVDAANSRIAAGGWPKPSFAKPSKYGNRKTNGYASKREAKRAQELLHLESTGKISGLAFQVPFELIPAQYIDGKCVERACKYVCDFTYYQDGKRVVEDSKGFRDPVYRIKRKMMLQIHGVKVLET